MERKTFADPAIKAALAGWTLLRADVTSNSADDKALLACFGYLDQLGAGTAVRVVTFIQTGAGRTILPDLQAKKIQVAEAPRSLTSRRNGRAASKPGW